MGTDDADEESHFSGGIGQSLIMMNGDLMRHAASSEHAGLLTASREQAQVRREGRPPLPRRPFRASQLAASWRPPARILANSGGNEAIALEDIWWALLNSNEFILDH